MFHALAMLIALVRPLPASLTDICELPNVIPGRTPSSSCMGCHDGTVGPLADVRLKGLTSDDTASHPVDLDYEEAGRRRPGTLTPAAALPSEVMLQDGKITCLTCHHPDSPERFRVAVTLERSALCHACHQL